jgi:hypothetical protein
MNWSLFQCVMTLMFFGLACKLIEMKLNSRQGWRPRLISLALLFVFFMSGITLDRGWPSRTDLPTEFMFIHAVVQKPQGTDEGNIVLIIRTKDNPNMPYSVMLPYDAAQAELWKMASVKVTLDGEIPVSYDPDTGYKFHLNAEPEKEAAKSRRMVIEPPKFRSA